MAAPNFGSQGRGLAIGFIAGAVSALTFHAFAWWVFYLIGMQAIPPYPTRPNMISVPLFISLAFWAGVWGMIMVWLAPRLAQSFLIVCLIVSLAASVVQVFALPPLRGGSITWDMIGILRSFIINGVWAVGVAIIAPLISNALGQRSHA